jgi:hypothetical protein
MRFSQPILFYRFLIFSAFVFSLLPVTAIGQVKTYHAGGKQDFSGRNGFYYYLPRTYFRIDVDLKKIHHYKGPYADYASQILGIENVTMANTIEYVIATIRVSTFAEPDPDAMYFLEYGEKQSKEERNILAEFTDKGMIKSFSFNIPLLGNEATSTAKMIKGPHTGVESNGESDLFRYFATPGQEEKTDTVIRMITIDTSTIEDITYNHSLVNKTMEERAMDAAEHISDIRDSRYKLLTGYQEVGYDRFTMEYMDRKLMEMEDQYLSLFRGSVVEEVVTSSLIYLPTTGKNSGQDIVFRFSKDKGLRPMNDVSADPVYILIEDLATLPVSSLPAGAEGINGFVCRIPAQSTVTVTYKDKTYYEGTLEIAQRGVTVSLPMSDKIKMEFYPGSGALKRVDIR